MKWLMLYADRLKEVSERQTAAAKGEKYVSPREFSPERTERLRDRIREKRKKLKGDRSNGKNVHGN